MHETGDRDSRGVILLCCCIQSSVHLQTLQVIKKNLNEMNSYVGMTMV